MHSKPPRAAATSPSRRTFVQGLFLGGVAASTGLLRIPDARARDAAYAAPGATLIMAAAVRPAISVEFMS